MVDDKSYSVRLKAPLYYDGEGRLYPHPTIYTTSGEHTASISYNEAEREYTFVIKPGAETERGIHLEVHATARSIPFWIGKLEGPHVIHAVYSHVKDIDIWGAYWDVGKFKGKLSLPDERTFDFGGMFLFDKAAHRAFYSRHRPGHVLAFSCVFLQQGDDLDMMIAHSDNPSPVEFPKFQHQGRINFPSRGKDFSFDDFQYTDNGGLQPTEYYLTGKYEGGEVNLKGRPVGFSPEKWKVNVGTWWDPNARFTWGRAFISWTGAITLDGETIEMNDTVSAGEFTRVESDAAR